jgi:S1-C subfamily serine protease
VSRLLTFAIALASVPQLARGDDGIAPETVVAVKKATVLVLVKGDGWESSGSGFVVAADERRVLVATNQHVVVPKHVPVTRSGPKPAFVTVVFDSGTKAERSYRATVAVAEADPDLAVLRVEGVKDAPKPVAPADRAKLVETLPVYTFGFPFGTALSTTDGFPAVTVGRAHVSSLRNGPDGELAVVQIDGNLNPGNSGGPVVDAKGGLVGVAVATVRNGQGIGFAVPGAALAKLMRGRVGRVSVTPRKEADGTITVRIEAELIDPADRLASAVAHYVVLPSGAKQPEMTALDKHPGRKTLGLAIGKGSAAAEFKLPAAEGQILVQVAAGATEQVGETTVVRAFSLTAGLSGPPPAGWKEYTPADRAYVMWVPEKPTRQTDEERELVVGGQTLRIRTLVGTTAGGLTYEAQAVALPASFAAVPRAEVHDLFRGAVAAELGGRMKDTKDVNAGTLAGVEYVVVTGPTTARVRVYVAESRVYLVSVRGTAAQATGPEAETLLGAFRLPAAGTGPAAGASAPKAAGSATATPAPKAKTPTVVGGNGTLFGGAPFVKDVAPDGGLLVGLEVVIGRPIRDELVLSVRPIYRAGEKETFGRQFGTVLDSPTTVKAKPGYAVGGIAAKARNVCDGFSITFMKVTGGKLDPTDRYESEWVGWNGGVAAVRVESDGTPVVGFVGRANDRDVTGIGVLFQGQEGFDPIAALEPTILGGGRDPQFKDAAPNGGLLVGFEVGTARAFGREMTRSVRPIYRAGDAETFGEQRGTQLQNVVTIKAKPGYAVGAISVMHGLGFDGIAVTFMKVKGDRLDPADRYESEYVGSDEKKPLTRLGGDGTPVIGIVGKTNARDLTGLGLLLKGQEGFTPKPR